MPFFNNDNAVPFFQTAKSVWLWVALTVPTTIACFIFYFWRQQKNKANKSRNAERDVEASEPAMKQTETIGKEATFSLNEV